MTGPLPSSLFTLLTSANMPGAQAIKVCDFDAAAGEGGHLSGARVLAGEALRAVLAELGRFGIRGPWRCPSSVGILPAEALRAVPALLGRVVLGVLGAEEDLASPGPMVWHSL